MVLTLEAGSPRRVHIEGGPLGIGCCASLPLSDNEGWLRLAHSLRGQFAIVVAEANAAVVITDLTGCYPVFRLQGADGRTWKLATSLAELENDSRRTVRRTALMQYVAFGTMDMDGETIYTDIDRVPAGSAAFYSKDRERVTEYAEWVRMIGHAESDADVAGERLEAQIRSYTAAQVKDGTLAILLSGGTDSTLLASILRGPYAGRLTCFTQDFRFKRYSEFSDARINAGVLGIATTAVKLDRTNHHAAMLALNSAGQDQPCANLQPMNLWCLTQAVSDVCRTFMAGEHADSLFLGFGHFFSGFPADSNAYTAATNALSAADKLMWTRPRIAATDSDAELLQALEVPAGEYREWSEDFARRRQARLEPYRDYHLTTIQQLDGQIGGGLSWQRIILPVTRSLSGVRVLTPFFDGAVIELALGLNFLLKYRDGKTKFLLRYLLRKHLGREIPKRPAAASPVAIWRLIPSMRERSHIAPWLRPYYDRVSRANLTSAGRMANQHVKTAALGVWMGARKL